MSLENLQAQFNSFGVPAEVFLAVALMFVVTGLLALRELMIWYFKMDRLHNEIKSLRSEISELCVEVRSLTDRNKILESLSDSGSKRQLDELFVMNDEASTTLSGPTRLATTSSLLKNKKNFPLSQ